MKLRVLVVDDDLDIRNLVTLWLKEDYDIESVVDGNECLKKIEAGTKYDLILLDVMMPGPRSPELIKRIAAKLPKIKIIYLTAVEMFSPTKEQEQKSYQPIITPEVKGYLVKPINKTQLINKIKEVLEMEKMLKKEPKK